MACEIIHLIAYSSQILSAEDVVNLALTSKHMHEKVLGDEYAVRRHRSLSGVLTCVSQGWFKAASLAVDHTTPAQAVAALTSLLDFHRPPPPPASHPILAALFDLPGVSIDDVALSIGPESASFIEVAARAGITPLVQSLLPLTPDPSSIVRCCLSSHTHSLTPSSTPSFITFQF